jgi:O-antigen/teichoic acid export membrane protein
MSRTADPAKPTLASQAGQAVVWNTLFLPAKFAAEIGVNLLQLNILSVAAVGMLALIRGAVGAIGTWVDLGIERALPKFIPEVERSGGSSAVRRLLVRVMAVKFAVLLVFSIGLWQFRDLFLGKLTRDIQAMDRLSPVDQAPLLNQIEQRGWFFVAAIVLLLILGAVYDVLIAYLISYFRQRAWNSITLANALLLPLLISGVLLLGWDVTGVVIAMVLTAIFGVILAVWQVRSVARAQSTGAQPGVPQEDYMRRFVPYSALSYLFNVSDFAASHWFAIFLVGNLRDAAILWTAVNLVRQILSYLYMPMVGLQIPLFTRARAGEGGTLASAYAAVSRVLLLLLVPGGVGLVLLAQPLVLAQYPQYVSAVPAIMLLTPLLFLESLLATSQNALMVAEQYTPVIISRMVAFIAVPLLVILAPRYGAVGAAAALGSARLLAGLIVFVAGQRLLNLKFPVSFALRLIAASSLMAAVLLFLTRMLPNTVTSWSERLALFGQTLGIAAIAAAFFVLAFRLLGGLETPDRQQLAATRLPFKRLILRVL